jgi:hypothetical protein
LANITDAGTLAGLSTVGTTNITNDAVTLAKIQNATANSRLLGSGAAGSGVDYAELALGTNLSMSGTTLNMTTFVGLVDEINRDIGTVANRTYVLSKATFAYTIDSLWRQVKGSGSCTIAIQIAGTNITWTGSVTTVSATTSGVELASASAFTVAIGNEVTMVITGNSACLDLFMRLKITRT